MSIPAIEQAKIQARVLVPLVKALQEELGEERANAVVRKALGDMYRSLGEKWWRAKESQGLGENMSSAFEMYAAGDALDYKLVEQSQDRFEIDVTGCRYAEFYKLTRTKTIMQGASHCDFRYARRKEQG